MDLTRRELLAAAAVVVVSEALPAVASTTASNVTTEPIVTAGASKPRAPVEDELPIMGFAGECSGHFA